MTSHITLTSVQLAAVHGGATQNQAQLRALAQQYCPKTYAANQHRREITRPIAEQCLAEAGLSRYSSYLDRYFPKK